MRRKSSPSLSGSKRKLYQSNRPTFEVEQMEQRLLLSANLYDPADTTGPNEVKGQIRTQIVETLNQLGNLGDALNQSFDGTLVPLIDQSLGDVAGGRIGDFFKFATGQASIDNYLNGPTPTSEGLRLVIETSLTDFKLTGTVTDLSTPTELNLVVNLNATASTTVDLRLGEAEEELNIRIENGTGVDLTKSRSITFRIMADLSSVSVPGATQAQQLAGLGDDKFWLDLTDTAGTEGFTINANSLHTSTTDELPEFGVQVGILGMREAGSSVGAYALSGADFRLDVSGEFDFSPGAGGDDRFDLSELKAFQTAGNWSDAYQFTAPTIGTQNTASLSVQIAVANDPLAATHIGGLGGVTGTVTFRDSNLFDSSAPLVRTDGTLASFARLTNQDILNMAGGVAGWAFALQASGLYRDDIPFLDLSSGDAYALGQAFQNAFLAQLQSVEQVLTARNAPSTWSNAEGSLHRDPLDLSGSASFMISVNGGAWTTATLTTDPGRDTLEKVAAALNLVLPAGVLARVRDTNSPRLELYAAEGTSFVLTQFSPEAAGRLDLGFNPLQQLALANNAATAFGGTFTQATQMQLPGIIFDSSAAVNLADFKTTVRTLTFAVNGAAPVSISIPLFDYANLETLIGKIQAAITTAGLHDPAAGTGVNVAKVGDGIRIFGGADVHSLQLGGTATPFLHLATSAKASPYFEFKVNGSFDEIHRVYVPGNLTSNLLGRGANATVNDLVEDIRSALTNSTYLYRAGVLIGAQPLLDEAASTGIDIRGSLDEATNRVALQFFARNPGPEAEKIQEFEITAQSGLAQLGFSATDALAFVGSDQIISPNFDTVQEFAGRIKTINGTGGVAPSFDTNTLTFNFPVEFDYSAPALVDDPATPVDERIQVRPATTNGDITNLTTASRVEVERTTTSEFDFQFSLKPAVTIGEVLEVRIPVTIFDWDGRLTEDAVITVVLEDGVQHDLLVLATDAALNLGTQDFVDQLTAAITVNAALAGRLTVSLEGDAADGSEVILFRTDPATLPDNRVLQILVRPEITSPVVTVNAIVDVLNFPAGVTSLVAVEDEVHATAVPIGFNLDRHIIFEVSLFDGSVGRVFVNAGETDDNQSMNDLIDDLNFAIEQSEDLRTFYDGAKIIAFADLDGKVAFKLSPTLFPANGTYATEEWSIEFFDTYRAPAPNGAAYDLNFSKITSAVAKGSVPLTALSGDLAGTDPYRLSSPAVLRLSVNGSDYTNVTIPAGLPGASLGDLITDFNTALGAASVVIGTATTPLSTFLRAVMSEDGTKVAIRSLAAVSGSPDEVVTLRVLADGAVVNNAAITQLGFSTDEQRAGWRGGDVYLDNVRLTGTATVTAETVTAIGTFGFAEFEARDGTLDLRAKSSVLLSEGGLTRFTLNRLNDLVSSDRMESIATFAVDPTTFVTLVLKDLDFTGAAVDGLAFGAPDATITFRHVPSGSLTTVPGFLSRINDFGSIPEAYVTYYHTAGMEKLSGVGFEDVFQGLVRTAEFISDQMRIDPDGSGAAVNAYATKLLFVKESLANAFKTDSGSIALDFGRRFEEAVADLVNAPPRTLQGVEQALAAALGVADLGDLSVRLDTTYMVGTSTLDSENLESASIELNLPFVDRDSARLDLSVDLIQLRNRSSDPEIVRSYLAGLDSLTTSTSQPIQVDLTALSTLDLFLGVEFFKHSIAIPTRSILRGTTTIDTAFNLNGANINGDLPVGVARFRLADGRVAINETGEVDTIDEFNTAKQYNDAVLLPGHVPPVLLTVAAATTADLRGIYNGSTTLTGNANGALVVDGVTVTVGDRVLVNNQEDERFEDNAWVVVEADGAQNGVYLVAASGDANTPWLLTRDVAADTSAELNGLHVHVAGGATYGGRNFLQTQSLGGVGAEVISFAKLIDPAVFEIELQGDFQLAYAATVATTSALGGTYTVGPEPSNPAFRATLTGAGNGSINSVRSTLSDGREVTGIDGFRSLVAGDLVLVKNQTSVGGVDVRYQNGVYRIVDVGENGASGRPWQLERADFADEPAELIDLRVSVQQGSDNGRVGFVQENNIVSGYTAGEDIRFTSRLNRVYQNYNPVTEIVADAARVIPNGQARAYLPMVIVVTDAQGNEKIITKNTSQLSPAQIANPDFMATQPNFDPVDIRVVSYGGRSGLDRMFDLDVESNIPGVPAPVVFFANPDLPADELPNLGANIPPTDVLNILRDPFLMGDALDLALFNLQFAIDQALGNELPLLGLDLPSYALFIEDWRSGFTNDLRDKLRNDKLKPINAILDALFTALGPAGKGYLTNRSQIRVETLGSGGTATVWDPANADNYDLTPANEEFEKSPSGAVSLQFSLDLVKLMDGDATETNINRIFMGDEVGLEIDNRTTSIDANFDPVSATGGVNLRTAFTLHLGFGVNLTQGFYLYNPADDGTGPDEPLMEIEVQAVLDGNLAVPGVQVFEQGSRFSTLHQLDVQIADAVDVNAGGSAMPTNRIGEQLGASGFYGRFDFFLNTGDGGGADDGRVTVPDMQQLNTLGLDRNTGIPLNETITQLPYGILGFELNGDADIHLLIEGGKVAAGIPDIQTHFYYQGRFGAGSSQIRYATDAEYGDAIAAVAAGNASESQTLLAAQPTWRNNRAQLVDEVGGVGYAFTDITVDAEGLLRGTIFEMLLDVSEGLAPIRPILDFLLTPVPGTEWMAQPFILGDLLGTKFVAFAKAFTSLDDMVRALGTDISNAQAKPNWAKPRVQLVSNSSTAIFASSGLIPAKKTALTVERERIQKYVIYRRVDAYQRKLDRAERAFNNLVEPQTDDRTAAQRLRDSALEKVTTPNAFSNRFEKFRDKGFAKSQGTGVGTRLVNAVKDTANDALVGTDDRGGRKSPIFGITGGGFRVDALKLENVNKILRGEEANLMYFELPELELGIAYSRSFPLPAFPPLVATIGTSLSIKAHLKFGWDTQGFYWSTLNTDGTPSPAFGVSATFSVGVGLNFGLFEAGIQAFFQLDLDFNWNDVTVGVPPRDNAFFGGLLEGDTNRTGNSSAIGYGKLRQSQIDFLKNIPGADAKAGNLFDVTLTGTIGLTFYLDLTIPVPIVGPITKRIAEKTFSMELFKVTWYADKPAIQLGVQNGDTLTLNMGQYAARRLFGDTTPTNEVFTLRSVGTSGSSESIVIEAILQGQLHVSEVFTNVKLIFGYAGGGQSVIDASSLQVAQVNFWGGSGNSILTAGAGVGSTLRGGTGTATLNGAPATSTTLIAGRGNTIIYGGTAADRIESGPRSDLLSGGGGGDTYVFVDNFGRDRLLVSGTGNTVDFSGVSADLTYDLGRLVQSAKAGNNTLFFAPDSAGANTVNNWISGPGDDRFNTFFFAPNQTLDLRGGMGENFYAVTLGSSYQRFYSDTNPGADTLLGRMDPKNIGRINIVDAANTGSLLIKQTFPERIAYSSTFISNGREQATMSGILSTELDAGNFTVVWGDAGTPWIDLGTNSKVTAGTIEMRSNVEAQGLSLFLKRGFSVTQTLALRNNSNLTLTIQNADPLANANLSLGRGPTYNDAWTPGIYSSSGTIFTAPGVARAGAPDGNGSGTLRFNLPTGSLINSTLGLGAGILQAGQGNVIIKARDTIGFALDPVKINAMYLAAVTTKDFATSAQGINVTSDGDITATSLAELVGLHTASGRIELTVAAGGGSKISYGNLFAGGGRDIFLNADEYAFTSGGIRTSGNVYFRNVTDNRTMRIGDTATVADTFNVTRRILDSVARTGNGVAANIIVGRGSDDPIRSGVATVLNYGYSQGLIVRGSEIQVPGGAGALTSASKLQFEAYESTGAGAGSGSILFGANILPINAPTILATAFRDITVDTTLQSTAMNGLIELKAGQGGSSSGAADNSGTVTVSATGLVQSTAAGTNLILFGGLQGGDIVLNGSVRSAQDVSLQATGGSITVDATAIVGGLTLEALAKESSTLRTDVETILRGRVIGSGSGGGENLVIHETDDVLLSHLLTDAGSIEVHAGGEIQFVKVDATKGFDVEMTAGGAITGVDQLPDFNVRADHFTASAGGEISFVSDINTLTANTNADGNILVNNIGGQLSPLTLEQVQSFNGRIAVDTEGDLTAEDVVSLTSSIDNSITLQTRELFGGNIIVDTVDAGSSGDVLLRSGGLNLGGALTWGGTITSDPAGTGRVGARQLTAFAGGFADYPEMAAIDLRTDVQDLIARALTGGDPTHKGIVGSDDSRADIVIDEANDIRLRRVETIFGDINVTAGGEIVHQAVRSPNRDITLNATSISVQLDEALSDGVALLPAKLLGRDLHVTAQNGITINTTVDRLIVESLATGDLTITESDSALFESVLTNDGDISITSGEFNPPDNTITKGGNAILGIIRAGATGGDEVHLTAYGQMRTSGQRDAGGNLLPNDPSLPNAKITADLLEASSYGRLDLVTNIDRLIAENFEFGNVIFTENNEITIERLVSKSGSIDLTAGGTITALYVQSKEDLVQAVTFDVTLHATVGDVLVDKIDVGSNFNDIIILADLGNIEEIDPQDPDDSFDDPATAGIDLVGDRAVLTAQGSIGSLRPLETQLNSLEARSLLAGNFDLNEHDAIVLTNIETADGSITLDAGGTITATNVVSLTDAENNDISLHNTGGDILVAFVNAGPVAGDLFLTSDAGNIDEVSPEDPDDGFDNPATAGIDLIADHAVLNAFLSIGGTRPFETRFNTLEAHSLSVGNIDLNEHDAITLVDVDTNEGAIGIDAGGTIIALDVQSLTDGEDNDITLHNSEGDILLGKVWAQRVLSDVILTSDSGGVDSLNPLDPEIDLQGDEAIITALDSIGGRIVIDTELNRLTARVLESGDIALKEKSGIRLDLASTANGSITINAAADIEAVDVRTGIDSSSNHIRLNAGGTLYVDEIISGVSSFVRVKPAHTASVTLNADRILELGKDREVDIRGASLDMTSRRDIGSRLNAIETSGRTIRSVAGIGANTLKNFADGIIAASRLSTLAGPVFFEQFGGTITFDSVSAGTGGIELILNGGRNMLVNSVRTGLGNLTLTVHDNGRLQVVKTDIFGNGFFRADEMDFTGGEDSLFGTGKLKIRTDNPGQGILVKPYGIILFDDPATLEMDIDMLAANDFSGIYFDGNVLFVLPVIDLSSGIGIGDLELGSLPGNTGEGPGISLFRDTRAGSMARENSAGRDLVNALASRMGYSPFSLTGLYDSIFELVFSGALTLSDFEALFAPYFGFHPAGLDGLSPDLFDRLAESLGDEPATMDVPPGDQVSLSEQHIIASGAGVEPEWKITRGPAVDLAVTWDSGAIPETEAKPSPLLALQMLPVTFLGWVSKVTVR